MALAPDPGRHGPDDATDGYDDAEAGVGGEAEASRAAPPRHRVWPWVAGATALPILGMVTWSILGPQTLPQPKAASVVTVSPPAYQPALPAVVAAAAVNAEVGFLKSAG